jgi:hypothetical protein
VLKMQCQTTVVNIKIKMYKIMIEINLKFKPLTRCVVSIKLQFNIKKQFYYLVISELVKWVGFFKNPPTHGFFGWVLMGFIGF